jgi:hypothetical protein
LRADHDDDAMHWEHYAAVPAPDGASLLVVDGRLPSIDSESWQLPELRDAFAPLIGRPALSPTGGADLAPERIWPLSAVLRGELEGETVFPLFDRARFFFDPDDWTYDDRIAAALSCLHQAVSYRDILAAMEPDDRWWFADQPRSWLERAVTLVS